MADSSCSYVIRLVSNAIMEEAIMCVCSTLYCVYWKCRKPSFDTSGSAEKRVGFTHLGHMLSFMV